MKGKLIFVLVAFFALLLSGCGIEPGGNQGGGNTGPGGELPGGTETEFDNQFNKIKEYIEQNVPYIVTEDITLIEEYSEFNALIEWTSSDEDVINFLGNVSADRSKATEVTLTYNVIIGEQQKTGTIDIIVSPVTLEVVADRFEKQFTFSITRDYKVKDKFYELFFVEWSSSNLDVFDNQGNYYKPANDVDFELHYVIKYGDKETMEKTIKLTAAGKSDLEKLEEVDKWLNTDAVTELYLSNNTTLPTYYEPLGINITWQSTNEDVVSSDGKIRHYVFERYVTLIASYDLGNGSGGSSKYECIVAPLDISKMTEKEIIESFLSAIAMDYYKGVKFGGNGLGCNTTYGHLNFYVNEESVVDVNLIPEKYSNRTGIKQEVKLIVCHDTGNMNPTADAGANANYVRNGYGGSSTGWHYTVGNDGVYQTVPDDEVAYNANGSSDTYTTFIKTNVKATWKKPNFSVSDDYYIMINNQKTDIRLPNTNAKLANDGPVWNISDDGYYQIAKLWYCGGHGFNATQGGNANGIGIESAVNNGSDYLLTCRIFAKLVAELTIKHDLDLSRVVQHNTMSGKDCPNAMRATSFWYTFKDMISLERFAKQYLADYTFTWSGTGDIDDTGRIKLGTTAKEVKYSVVVSKNGTSVVSKSYTTKIN